MRIYKYIHSCFLLEKDNNKILIDPGPFTFIENKVKPEDFQNINAILITHQHYDHYDPEAIKIILSNNSDCQIFTNQSTSEVLKEVGIDSEILEKGVKQIANFEVKAFFAEHEPLPLPLPPNTAFLIDDLFLHPGDSFDKSIFKTKAKVLALPVAAPWLNIMQSLEFVSQYKPEHVLPAHDGFIKDFFIKGQYGLWDKILAEKQMKFHKLDDPGKSMEI